MRIRKWMRKDYRRRSRSGRDDFVRYRIDFRRCRRDERECSLSRSVFDDRELISKYNCSRCRQWKSMNDHWIQSIDHWTSRWFSRERETHSSCHTCLSQKCREDDVPELASTNTLGIRTIDDLLWILRRKPMVFLQTFHASLHRSRLVVLPLMKMIKSCVTVSNPSVSIRYE